MPAEVRTCLRDCVTDSEGRRLGGPSGEEACALTRDRARLGMATAQQATGVPTRDEQLGVVGACAHRAQRAPPQRRDLLVPEETHISGALSRGGRGASVP